MNNVGKRIYLNQHNNNEDSKSLIPNFPIKDDNKALVQCYPNMKTWLSLTKLTSIQYSKLFTYKQVTCSSFMSFIYTYNCLSKSLFRIQIFYFFNFGCQLKDILGNTFWKFMIQSFYYIYMYIYMKDKVGCLTT